ncbi:MAG: NAD-dependent epimerase [Thermoplasmata archaeon]|nr:MAG: NAD-dependent epimerase [Thermoplasmata archaeon]
MKNKVLITGGLGLIGSACCDLFAKKGWHVFCVDNDMRSYIFGKEASTTVNKEENGLGENPDIVVIEADIRDRDQMKELIVQSNAVVHCAAQPSHPKSLENPVEDFNINAWGTLLLLELVRLHNPEIPFAFMSSNKVYGDFPNYFNYKIVGQRYENVALDAFNEELPIDRCGHTPFGVSKVAGDLYCQEYARNYRLVTATFRGGCLTGKNSRAVEMHGYLPYIIKCTLTGKTYTIFGGGYRVRDQIHSSDVATALYQFITDPKQDQLGYFGKPYNLGGERRNSISIYETIDAIAEKTGKKLVHKDGPERESDHIWWISDMSKFRKDYPSWEITKDLDFIFNEIIEHLQKQLGLPVKNYAPDYFKRIRG